MTERIPPPDLGPSAAEAQQIEPRPDPDAALVPVVDPEAGPRQRLAGATGLRRRLARGTVVNSAFTVGLQALGMLKGFIVAAFITTSEYGIWTILIVSLGTLMWLKQLGIGEKYVQQDDEDQQLAFQKAFTLEFVSTSVFVALLAALLPVLALVYGRFELIAPGLLLMAMLLARPFGAPLWIYYRRMDFLKQRSLAAVQPVVAFVVTVSMAIAGAGYWSLVTGLAVGAWAGSLAAVIACPYPLRLRYDRGTFREYLSFSWPLIVQGGGGIIVAQGSVLIGEAAVGIAGVGLIGLAVSLTDYAHRANRIVAFTLYPVICAVKERTDLLFESFVKSNRLALIWAVPFGVGVALFASDVVTYGIGEQWRPAVLLLQVFGLAAAIDHIGFNWDAFYRARGDTRPVASVSLVAVVSFFAVPVPLIILYGINGFAIGMSVHAVVAVAARAVYLRRLFPDFAMARHVARAFAPTAPAAAAVLGMRLLEGSGRSFGVAAAELVTYLAVTAVATFALERKLLGEVRGYLRRAQAPEAEPAT